MGRVSSHHSSAEVTPTSPVVPTKAADLLEGVRLCPSKEDTSEVTSTRAPSAT